MLVQAVYSFTYILLSKDTFHHVQFGPVHNSTVHALQYAVPIELRFRETDKIRTNATYACASCNALAVSGSVSTMLSRSALIRRLHLQAKFLHLRCGLGNDRVELGGRSFLT